MVTQNLNPWSNLLIEFKFLKKGAAGWVFAQSYKNYWELFKLVSSSNHS